MHGKHEANLDTTLNIRGELYSLATPKVMGIVNVTPDSFYSGSRCESDESLRRRLLEMDAGGVDIIDIGACSTRPGAREVPEEVERERLSRAVAIARETLPEKPVSIDTYRARIARLCVEEYGADIVNDVSGGTLDPEMWETVAGLRVPYVLMHMRGTPATMQAMTDYGDVTAEVLADLSKKVYELRGLGVNDIIIDPGFGFAKTAGQNFQLLDELGEFTRMGLPVLAGMSRKGMVWKTLGITPEESLEGTVALGAFALDRGASVLRVHDVKAAAQSVRLYNAMKASSAGCRSGFQK